MSVTHGDVTIDGFRVSECPKYPTIVELPCHAWVWVSREHLDDYAREMEYKGYDTPTTRYWLGQPVLNEGPVTEDEGRVTCLWCLEAAQRIGR